MVLTGAGRAFSAGADLKAMSAGKADGEEVRRQLEDEYGLGIRSIMDMGKPVIAAVEGLVAGIGCAFVLASDLVVMAEDAYFTLPFHNIALVPDGGINWLLERQVGARRAFEFTRRLHARPGGALPRARPGQSGGAQGHGGGGRAAVGRAVGAARATRARAQQAAAAPGRPRAISRRALASEIAAQSQCIDSQDFREGVAAFLEKREPRFTGR